MTATVQREFVEKPPHIDERRMRHIPDDELFAALDLSRPGLDEVRAAAAESDWSDALAAWARYVARRERPVPVVNTEAFGRFLRERDPARGAEIVAAATALWDQEIDFTDRAKGKSGLYGFHYFGWITPLIDAYAMTGDDRHVAAFVRLFNRWFETRDLVRGEWPMDVIWYTLGLGIRSSHFTRAYHTFRHSPALDLQTQGLLLRSLLGAMRWLADEHDAFRYGNWQHHGVTSLFEQATFWPEFREAHAWAELAWTRLIEHLELDVYADGGHLERSPSYHTGVLDGFRRAALAAELNWTRRLQDYPRFQALYRWLMDHTTPLGCSTTFNDSGVMWTGPHLVQAALLFGDAEAKWLAERLGTADEIAGVLAALPDQPDGRTAAEAFAELASRPLATLSALQPVSKFAVMRGGWGADDRFLAVNYGPHVGHELESHSHHDPLSFVCYGHGVPLAVEAGGPNTYDDPGYYDWYQHCRAHNVLVVDGQSPAADDRDADLLLWATSPVGDVFQGVHAGYRTAGVHHRRTIVFVRDDYWVVHDDVAQDGAHELAWQLYSATDLDVGAERIVPASRPGLMILSATPTADDRWEPIEGVMAIPVQRAFNGEIDRRMVRGVRRVRQTGESRVAWLHALYPLDQKEDADGIRVEPVEVRGGEGEACAVSTPGGRDLIVVGAGESVTERAVEEWESDARVWMVREDGSWLAAGGRYVRRGGDVLFEASAPLASIAVWPEAGGVAGEVTVTRKTFLRVGGGAGERRFVLNGIVVPREERDGGAGIQLPAAGTYRIAVTGADGADAASPGDASLRSA